MSEKKKQATGKNKTSPLNEMVLAAIENGMHALGFSTHSYTSRDLTYCIKKEKLEAILVIGSLITLHLLASYLVQTV